jgi:hypothetical protein
MYYFIVIESSRNVKFQPPALKHQAMAWSDCDGFKRVTIAIEMSAVRDGGLSKQTLPRRKFTLEEDVKLRTLVESLGTKSWEEIARFIPERSARQCRDRYKNYLLESLVTEPWTAEEDALVVQKYHQIGPK